MQRKKFIFGSFVSDIKDSRSLRSGLIRSDCIQNENFKIVLSKIMPLKCCVPCGNSNYDSTTEKVTVYKFFLDENEKAAFIKAISPQNLVVT